MWYYGWWEWVFDTGAILTHIVAAVEAGHHEILLGKVRVATDIAVVEACSGGSEFFKLVPLQALGNGWSHVGCSGGMHNG